jgi:hypothetical protein
MFAASVVRIYSDELARRGVREDVLIAALEATGARAAEFLTVTAARSRGKPAPDRVQGTAGSATCPPSENRGYDIKDAVLSSIRRISSRLRSGTSSSARSIPASR